MSALETTKVCGVCGEKAIARNFCAMTCESCKAFFRRNASKINEFNCIFGNECEINFDTRKRCRKCRLKKCFKIGMRKEWILNEEEKKVRNNKIEENRKKKQKDNISSTETDIPSPLILTDSVTNSESDILEVSEESLLTHIDENLIDINQSLKDDGTDLVPIFRPITDYNNNFTENEGNVLTELLNATKFLTILVSDVTSETKSLSDAMRIISLKWDEEIRKIVKTAKNLTAFKNICKDDQISLFKYASVEIAFLRSVNCYEIQDECWTIALDQDNATKLDLGVFKQQSFNHYEYCKLCMNKIAHLWDSDQLLAIILFMPTRPQLAHRSQIRLQQQIYMHLLKRYLQLKYRSETESKSRFSKLMEVISDLHDFHEQHIRKYLISQPSNYIFFSDRPLLKELYDKNCDNHSINSLN